MMVDVRSRDCSSRRVGFCVFLASAFLLGLCGPIMAAGAGRVWYPLGTGAGAGSVGVEFVPEASRSHQPLFVTVQDYDSSRLDWSVDLAGMEFDRVQTSLGEFVSVQCSGSTMSGDAGQPALPVIRRLFLAPPGADVSFTVGKAPATEVDVSLFGNGGRLVPMQPRPPATEEIVPTLPFEYDRSAYAKDMWLFDESVVMVEIGLLRGHRLFLIEVRPMSYNPARGLLRATPHLDISVRFEGGQPGGKYPGVLYRMSGTLLNPPGDQKEARGSGNYLIISAPDFGGTAPLLQFASAKTTQGFDVTTYLPPVGSTSDSIKAYILGLVGTADEPDYILLIGDTLNTGGTCSSFVLPSRVGGGSKTAVTDNYYACLDGGDDWVPDCSIGRFSVRTVAELQNIVDKTLHVADGVFADPGYTGRATFMAGTDLESDGEAVQDFVIDSYMTPNGMDSTRLYTLSYGSTTQDVTDAFNTGCSVAGYFGHSDVQFWTNGPYFHNDDIDALVNTGKYPFVFSISCSSSLFYRDWEGYEPCLNEQWIRVADKGAVATLGSTSNLVPHSWAHYADFYNAVWASLYEDGVVEIGESILAAELEMVAIYGTSDPFSRDVNEMWLLMGDPSLELPLPPQENYLIVTAEDYTESTPLANFISAKESAGFNVMVYEAPAGTTNTTIKSYIQSLWGTDDEPDYVLIVGDTDNDSTATASTIPHWNGGGSKHSPTDLPYVCVRGSGVSWYPDIPIGRFSVENTTHLESIVNKTLTVESGIYPDPDYVRRGAFLANDDTYGVAEATHDMMINKYFTPTGLTGTKIYQRDGAGTPEVRAAVNAGCLYTVYMGHSGSSGWWNPSFDQSDVNNMTNTGMYGLVFGWSCQTAMYESSYECFGETWLRAPNKGAAAYISASDFIYWGSYEQWEMSGAHEAAFFDAIFGDGIREIGAAWQKGLYRFLKDYGDWDGDMSHEPTAHLDICRNFLEEFLVLGDPSLRLPESNAFAVEVTPEVQSLCCPPSTQVQYTVNVAEIGTWTDSVQLTVEGVPVGATAGFSQNGLTPPFASILTISGLDAGDVGDYEVNVRGTSNGTIRTDLADLHISTTLPGSPSLTSPPNNSEDVDLEPTFVWQPVADATEYDLVVSTSPVFSPVVYSVTVDETSHTVTAPLGMQTPYFWRVRAANACGKGNFSSPFTFTTVNKAMPASYDLLNGETGTYTYYDDTYDGDGDNTTSLAPLTNGLGDLVDGVIATEHWNVVNTPYIGWKSIEPTITFHFAQETTIDTVTIHVDDDGGGGGVVPPSHITINMGGFPTQYPVVDPAGSAPFAFSVTDLSLSGTQLQLTLEDENFSSSRYMMLSEVEFFGTVAQGACCTDGVCAIAPEATCTAGGGEYLGAGTDCSSNPCAFYEPSCLIISEVIEATASGNCPKWIEITNTGMADYTFQEGGIAVQMDDETTLALSVDMTGVTIFAGQPFVLNSNHGGVCTGAFAGVYGFDPDLSAAAQFGDGNDRFILTDTADCSNILDIYGELGVNGNGEPWNYSRGYAYRLASVNAGNQGTFVPSEWYFGGPDSLWDGDPYALLALYTTPGVHVLDERCGLAGDMNCDGVRDGQDVDAFLLAVLDQTAYLAQGYDCAVHGDFDKSGIVDTLDIPGFANALTQD